MAKKSENYEDLMTKLENIVSQMEKGELALDDSIKNYEDGIKICNKLYKILNDAEGKIKILNELREGSEFIESEFTQNGE